MRRVILAALVVLGGIATVGVAPSAATHGTADECTFPVTVTDASGTEVTVEQEPQSVVVLQPSAAQTMWEIGAQDKVVGMPQNPFTSYLNGTETKTNVVGEQSTVLQSRVVDLNADLVLAPNITGVETVRSLREAGQTVYYFDDATSLDDVYKKTLLTGHLVGACDGAQLRTNAMRSTVDSVRANVSGLDSPSVLYALGGGFTAGSGTFIDTLITAAGGENVATEAGISGYGQISSEVIVQQNPDWLVVPAGTPLPQTEAVNATTAVQEGQILRVNSNYMNQPGPRNTIPLRQMAEAFHPDAFSADTSGATVTPTGAASPTATPTAGEGEPTATPTGDGTETPGASGPGFTAVLTVIGLLGTALLARRR